MVFYEFMRDPKKDPINVDHSQLQYEELANKHIKSDKEKEEEEELSNEIIVPPPVTKSSFFSSLLKKTVDQDSTNNSNNVKDEVILLHDLLDVCTFGILSNRKLRYVVLTDSKLYVFAIQPNEFDSTTSSNVSEKFPNILISSTPNQQQKEEVEDLDDDIFTDINEDDDEEDVDLNASNSNDYYEDNLKENQTSTYISQEKKLRKLILEIPLKDISNIWPAIFEGIQKIGNEGIEIVYMKYNLVLTSPRTFNSEISNNTKLLEKWIISLRAVANFPPIQLRISDEN